MGRTRTANTYGWKRGATVVVGSSWHGDTGPPDDEDGIGGSAGDCGRGEEEDDDSEEKEDATIVVVAVVGVVTAVCGRAKECVSERGEDRRRPGEE